jgi:hypothetical protein
LSPRELTRLYEIEIDTAPAISATLNPAAPSTGFAARPAPWSRSFAHAPDPSATSVFQAFAEAAEVCTRARDGGLRLVDGACFVDRLPS